MVTICFQSSFRIHLYSLMIKKELVIQIIYDKKLKQICKANELMLSTIDNTVFYSILILFFSEKKIPILNYDTATFNSKCHFIKRKKINTFFQKRKINDKFFVDFLFIFFRFAQLS